MAPIKIEILKGNITQIKADAIVNPANPECTMGGGAAKAILDKGGIEIKKQARKQTPIDIGDAIKTTGGELPVNYVIHTPTVNSPKGESNPKTISKAIKSVLKLAKKTKIKSIAIPGLGTGSGGVNYNDAAKTICKELKKQKNHLKIILVYRNTEYGYFLNKYCNSK